MALQNVIARLLCSLGGDRYTPASTETSLHEALQEARQNVIPFDLQTDRMILLSDLHKGAKNGADDFLRCEAVYATALEHYFGRGYQLCVMGDAEELWEEFPRIVLDRNPASFEAEKRFHREGRYRRLWGNHDDLWSDPKLVRRLLQPLYGGRPLRVPEAFLLEIRDGDKKLGDILLLHGHQGTLNEGKTARYAKWILHNVWRPLQILTKFSCNTPATDWRLRHDRDKLLYQWALGQPGLILIAGHTHAPVFASYSHRARLLAGLAAARAALAAIPAGDLTATQARLERLTSELRALEDRLSEEERRVAEPLENPLPCYFNTGCCAFEDGDITGIELSDGEIRLVRWPDDEDSPAPKVLQADSLRAVFQALPR